MADEPISREAAIKLLRGEAVAKYPMSFYMGLFAAADEISKLPSVNAVVLPCKVGDTVYVLGESVVSEIPVLQIIIDEDECFVCAIGDFRGGCYPFSAFGKTVFLTREEAEKALEGREDNAR